MASRRKFLAAIAAPALVGLSAKAQRRIAGSFVNDSFPIGHRLRDRAAFRQATKTETFPIAIVGGGMSGLCAAWRLRKRGFSDFVLLEMEKQPGGNSRWGENEVSAYPWAAHYVPVPDKNALLVRELFQELGVLKDGVWEERYLCFTPQERLFLHGRWQEGIVPETAATSKDRGDISRFQQVISEMRATEKFTIPVRDDVRDPALERITFAEWLKVSGFESEYLNWYADYACRDDYGARATATSAWAGLHYFAARPAETDDDGPLTWPEGNGWIARKLIARVEPQIRAGSAVYAITREGRKWRVRTEELDYMVERVIFAAPTFLASYLIEGAPVAEGFVYSPWLTANLTLDRMPAEGQSERAWDNVIYDSPALGYVVATHMSFRTVENRSVWTYYWSLTDWTPSAARAVLLEKDWGYWRDTILDDLSRAHPDIRQCVARIDIMRMGHAMARPVPGFLSLPARRNLAAGWNGIAFANSDLSGLSLFEEAQARGVAAADRVLRDVGRA
jgi:glycine/D-amino acid oxidase-like deaminating enzyme